MTNPYTQNYTKKEALQKVRLDGFNLNDLSDNLQNNKEVVLAAINQHGGALKYASDNLKNDKTIVLAAVTHTGWALEYVSEELQNDKEVVLAAITQNGYALKFAGGTLKNNRDLALTAVTQDGVALRFVSVKLKKDPVIKFIAQKKQFISEADWPIIQRALLEKPEYFLNPESYMRALTDDMNYPYLMLAQYALSKDIVIEPEALPYMEL